VTLDSKIEEMNDTEKLALIIDLATTLSSPGLFMDEIYGETSIFHEWLDEQDPGDLANILGLWLDQLQGAGVRSLQEKIDDLISEYDEDSVKNAYYHRRRMHLTRPAL